MVPERQWPCGHALRMLLVSSFVATLPSCPAGGAVEASEWRAGDSAPGEFSPGDALIRIDSSIRDAELWLDGRFIGYLGGLSGGVAVSPGRHRIEVRHQHYQTYYETIAVSSGDRHTVIAKMEPLFPARER